MMKFVLPTLLHQRRMFFLDLTKESHQSSEEFIVDIPDTRSQVSLFSLDKKRKLQSLVDDHADVPIRNLGIDVKLEDATIAIRFEEKSEEQAPDVKEKDAKNWKFEAVEDKENTNPSASESVRKMAMKGGGLLIKDTEHQFEIALEIEDAELFLSTYPKLNLICAYSAEALYGGLIGILLSPTSAFFHAVLDFGSEASQIKHKYTQTSMGVDTQSSKQENLFLLMKNYMGLGENADQYLQYSPDDKYLKSLFYIKHNLGEYNPFDQNFFLDSDQDQIAMLTTREQISTVEFETKYTQLPNLKLAHRHGSNLTNMMFGYQYGAREQMLDFEQIKEQIYATILKSMCSAYLYDNGMKSNGFYLRISILIPNIYGLQDLLKTKNIINKIMIESKSDPQMPKVHGWEIQTISESDASFLGYYNSGVRYTEADRHYIIIDSGKGTTDFSIIHTHPHNAKEVTPVYRNGFAGAGNLISYGYFESMLHFLIQESESKAEAISFYRNMISNLSDFQKQQLFQIIEQWKFSYNGHQTATEIGAQWRAHRDGDIGVRNLYQGRDYNRVLVFLSQLPSCADWGGYISEALDYISSNIALNLEAVVSRIDQENSIARVLFTGRAFLYPPLLEAVKKRLSDIGIDQEKIEDLLESSQLKSICLDGVLREGNIIHPEMIGIPIQIPLRAESSERLDDISRDHKSFVERMKSWATIFVDGRGYDNTQNELQVDTRELASSKFLMSNSYYSLTNPYFANSSNYQSMDFIFTNEGFFFRAKNEKGKILQTARLGDAEEVGFIERAQISASLFPAVIDERVVKPFSADYEEDDFVDFLPN